MTTQLRLQRFLFNAIYLAAIPLGMAAAVMALVTPDDSFYATSFLGELRTWFRDQKVPVLIALFTLFDVVMWRLRHLLPGSAAVTTPGRTDIPTETRSDFERASALLDEADKILREQKAEVTRELTAAERERLGETLDTLRAVLRAAEFDKPAFDAALKDADREVETLLDPWRKGELREYVESIGVAFGVALLLRGFVLEAFKIPSGSMIPSLQIDDHIFVNKLAYGPLFPWSKVRLWKSLPPKRSDIIVFAYPENPDQDFIKRVVGLPGDRVEVRSGHPIINGFPIPFCKVGKYSFADGERSVQRDADLFVEYFDDRAFLVLYEGDRNGDFGPYTVKPNEVFVLGDNRNNSHDSRAWFGRGGGVPFENIRGRAMVVWMSSRAPDRIGLSVMGAPRLPKELRAELGPGLEKCLRERPTKTSPPEPGVQTK